MVLRDEFEASASFTRVKLKLLVIGTVYIFIYTVDFT